jgi:hypothetical protein
MASGSETVAASAPEQVVDAKKMARSIYTSKAIGLGVGLGLAYFAGGTLFSLSTLPITPWVALFILFVQFNQLKRHWLLIVSILLGSQFFFWLAATAGITMPVFILGTAIFSIPGLLDNLGKKQVAAERLTNAGVLKNTWLPDFVKLSISLLVGAITPGVSTSLIILATSIKTNIMTQLTCQAAESGLEGVGLYCLLTGVASAKSLLGIEIGLQLFAPYVLWIVILGTILCSFYLDWAFEMYAAIAAVPGITLLSLAITVATVLVTGGLWIGGLMIVCGVLLKLTMKATEAPRTIASILFLGPCLR